MHRPLLSSQQRAQKPHFCCRYVSCILLLFLVLIIYCIYSFLVNSFISGQIPLNPATMKLFDPSLCANLLSSDLHRAVRDILAQALHSSSFSTAAATTGSYAADPYHSVDSSALSDTDLLQTHRLEHAQEQLCTLAVNFLVQVTLCLRHAHRVLQAMNSSLSRTLCCTVYVSLPALCTLYDVQSGASSSASTGDLVGLISEEQLVGFVRRMIAVMDKADGAAAAGSRRAPDGDSDGDNESDLEVILTLLSHRFKTDLYN